MGHVYMKEHYCVFSSSSGGVIPIFFFFLHHEIPKGCTRWKEGRKEGREGGRKDGYMIGAMGFPTTIIVR